MRLIDADALVAKMKTYDIWHETDYQDGYFDGFSDGIAEVEEAPTIEAEPVKHGKPNPHIVQWFGDEGEVILEDRVGWECPFCGEDGVKNYCPICGAKMDLEG